MRKTKDALLREAQRDALAAVVEEFRDQVPATEASLRERFAKVEAQADRKKRIVRTRKEDHQGEDR